MGAVATGGTGGGNLPIGGAGGVVRAGGIDDAGGAGGTGVPLAGGGGVALAGGAVGIDLPGGAAGIDLPSGFGGFGGLAAGLGTEGAGGT